MNPITLLKEGQSDERAAVDALLVAAEGAHTQSATLLVTGALVAAGIGHAGVGRSSQAAALLLRG